MVRSLIRATAMTAGLVLVLAACTTTTTPLPTQAPSSSASPLAPLSLPPTQPSAAPASSSPAPSLAPTPAASAPTGLSGSWTGNWQDVTPDQAAGTFTLTWTQSGTALNGNIVVSGTPCLSAATVSGSISGSKITFGAVSGTHTVVYDGTVSGTTMQGTYTAPAACEDATGTWTATKK